MLKFKTDLQPFKSDKPNLRLNYYQCFQYNKNVKHKYFGIVVLLLK